MPSDPAIFRPTPDQANRLLADLDSPDLSFRESAEKHGTNSNALAAWLNTTTVHQQVEETFDAVALRTRIVASSLLPSALKALSFVLQNHNNNAAPASEPRQSQAPFPAQANATNRPIEQPPDDFARRDQQRRRDETTRRAAYLVFRLANFFPPSQRSPRLRERPPAPPPAQVNHRAPNPGAVPLGLHLPTSAPRRNGPSPTNAAAPASRPATEHASSSAAPIAPTPTPVPISTFHSPLSTSSGLSPSAPSARNSPAARLLASAGACTSAAP